MADDQVEREIWPRRRIPRRPAVIGPGRERHHAQRAGGIKQAVADVQEKNRKMYRYTALPKDTARLMILKKKQPDNNEIYVELLQVPFNELDKHNYVALSYHWGEDEIEKPIYLHDLDIQRQKRATTGPSLAQFVENLLRNQFWVKLNLYDALFNIRNECAWRHDLKIWVDAVCIDQDNLDEKAEQVARMAEIYSRAAKVLIWLGGGNDASKEAIRFLKEDLSNLDNLRALVHDRDQANWGNLVYLMQSSWFSRRWVIQELAFARDAIVFCGNDYLHWDDLRDGISLFAENFESVRSLLGSKYKAVTAIELMKAKRLIDTVNNVFKTQSTTTGTEREPMQGLEYLVSTLSTYDTSNPRDTIHAFRNISKETYGSLTSGYTHTWHTNNVPLPSLDYKSSLLEVYAGFVKWIYASTRCIDIICRRWAIPERSPEHAPPGYVFSKLPSWIQTVDDFVLKDKSMGSRRHGNSFVGMPGESPYNACHNLVANVYFGSERPPQPSDSVRDPDEEPSTAADASRLPTTSDGLGVTQAGRRRAASASQIPSVRVSPPEQPFPPAGTPSVKRKRGNTPQENNSDSVPNDTPSPKRGKQSPLHLDLGNIASRLPGLMRPNTGLQGSSSNSPLVSPTWSDAGWDTGSVHSLVQDNNACVHIEGLRIGKVTWAVGPTTNGVVPKEALARLFGRGKSLDPENVSDRVWRSLIAERASHGKHSPVLSQKSCMWVIANNSAEEYIYTKELLQDDPPPPEPVKQYLNRVQEVIWDRCCIEVRYEGLPPPAGKDLYGFAPNKAKVGDILCDGLDEVYRLVGETYVYGLMDGEAISSRAKERLDADRTYFKIV
ncbi:hypothetical protein LTR95_002777 [Oleoguttula sp. CCFEE 5521]